MVTGRLAPSPTGTLHLGNLRTFLVAWLSARSGGGRVLLRFDDLDTTARRRHEDDQRHDLERLGLTWDGSPIRQSERRELYEDTLADLDRAGLTYRCWCSRREIREATTAPHGPPGAYPGTCRELTAREIAEREAGDRPAAIRLRTDAPSITVTDRLHGDHSEVVDDLVLRRGDGTPAYHLACVVDDHDQGVDEVVRADDLLPSTPRHAHLVDVLGWDRPAWMHVPLVLGPDGDRLAKRHGSVTLADRVARGESPQDVLGVLAASLGLLPRARPATPRELLDRFDPSALPTSPWVLRPDGD